MISSALLSLAAFAFAPTAEAAFVYGTRDANYDTVNTDAYWYFNPDHDEDTGYLHVTWNLTGSNLSTAISSAQAGNAVTARFEISYTSMFLGSGTGAWGCDAEGEDWALSYWEVHQGGALVASGDDFIEVSPDIYAVSLGSVLAGLSPTGTVTVDAYIDEDILWAVVDVPSDYEPTRDLAGVTCLSPKLSYKLYW